ncbi:hypothetical protein FHT87_000029 [Rhizobium sp. BK316]|nr:hypothetical protein [Rhizobium sp. BK316]
MSTLPHHGGRALPRTCRCWALRKIRSQGIIAYRAHSSVSAIKGRCRAECASIRAALERCKTWHMGGQHRRGKITASNSRSARRCESVGQGRRCVVDIALTVRVADRFHSMFNLMSAERRVVIGTVDKGTMLVSSRSLHECRKLSIILVPIGSLARPYLSADGQPLGNPRIH